MSWSDNGTISISNSETVNMYDLQFEENLTSANFWQVKKFHQNWFLD